MFSNRIHHTHLAELRRMVEEEAGAKLVFLAPYSPIDNPIEMGFNVLKACWRRHGWWLDAYPLDFKIRWCFENCYKAGGESARATYAECGYGY
jgi:hypothetical protein